MKSMPIFYELCRIGEIREIVNEMVKWKENNSKVSPGILIESLVISILCGKKALWRLENFWEKQDTDYLFREAEISSEQLNDDAYGRALDKLSEIKMKELIGKVSFAFLRAHNETIERIHIDTTSISVEGEYEKEVLDEEFDVNLGFSKDLRPDLKQFKIGAGVQQNGLPVIGELLSGNVSDRVWNPNAIKGMKEYFENNGYHDIVYIGDSATVSSYKSLKSLKGIPFISIFPETFGIVSTLKEKALQDNNWKPVEIKDQEEKYKIKSYTEKIEEIEYRFIVVNSIELRKKKEKTITKRFEREKSALNKKAIEIGKKAFSSTEEASTVVQEFLNKNDTSKFVTSTKVVEKTEIVYGKKGRPSKTNKGVETKNYYAEIEVTEYKKEIFTKICDLEGCFVLITSILDTVKYSDSKILEEYKGQNSVEQAFKFLKDPVYLGPVFLKNKKRIEALGYVYILVLLVASYFEYRVRKSLKDKNEFLPQPGGHKTQRPKMKTILETLELVTIITIGKERYLQKNIDDGILKVIEWAGFGIDIYLKHSVFRE
jgi:transposase